MPVWNIREAIDKLAEVANRLPAGLDSELHIWMCDGEGIETTRAFEIDHAAVISTETAKARSYYAIINAHPHQDPESGRHRPVAHDADEYVQRWAEEQGDGGPASTH